MDMMQVFTNSVCVGVSTYIFSVTRDAGTKHATTTRKIKEIQQVISPDRLSELGKFRQAAYRLCRNFGVKMTVLNDLWIVPLCHKDALMEGLLSISRKWDEFVQETLLPNYEDWVRQYAAENPQESDDIIRLAPTLEKVEKSTRFAFVCFSLGASDVEAVNVAQEVDGLWGQVLGEIAAEIKDAHMDRSPSFTQASKAVLGRIARKCRGLGFLHPRLNEVSVTVDELIKTLPTSGGIKGVDALAVRAVLDALLDPAAFMKNGFRLGTENDILIPGPIVTADDTVILVDLGNDLGSPVSSTVADVPSLDDVLRFGGEADPADHGDDDMLVPEGPALAQRVLFPMRDEAAISDVEPIQSSHLDVAPTPDASDEFVINHW